MNDLEVLVDGEPVDPGDAWRLEWTDRPHGVGRLVSGQGAVPVVVEGHGTEWTVTLGGRRIPVTVRTWRERLLAAADTSAGRPVGALAVRATLPGLVVAVRVARGDEVGEGDSLVTIEAMKMQNEVRAPRAARVTEVAVVAGQVVASGAALLTLE